MKKMRISSFISYALGVCFAVATLADCSGGTSTPGDLSSAMGGSPLGMTHSLVAPYAGHPFSGAGPTIKHVTAIHAAQIQKIVIKGTGFGTMQAYNGDSCCLEFTMTNENCGNTWQAGKTGELVTLDVKHWSDKKIEVTGFTGEYGQNCWVLNSGDPIDIQVWNAQTLDGPANWSGTVQ